MVFDSKSVCFHQSELSWKAIESTVIRKNHLAVLPVRLTPGALWLRYRQKFGHGVRVAWYRDVVRPRILKTPPVENTTDKQCEIHVLTSERDWLDLVWALKSFYFSCGRHYALCIHEDGSLKQFGLESLRRHFPAARIILRAEADAKLAKVLRAFPRSLEFRNTNLLAPKVFDFIAFLESDRMALFDSDILFFAAPTAYLQRAEDSNYGRNTFNADCGHGYTVEPETVRELIGHELLPFINTGFGLVHRNSVNWQWTEEFLALPGLLTGHFWRIEQTLLALCSSRFGIELLPDEYTLRLEPGIGSRPFRHYVGRIRHLMYGEGIARLIDDGFLERR
jgi:hypothetical protein